MESNSCSKKEAAAPQCSPCLRGAIIFAVILFALVVRGGVLWFSPHALEGDPDGYRRLAANLASRGVFGDGDAPTAFRPPLYPLLIACDNSRAAVGVLHVLLGAGTAWLTFAMGRRLGFGDFAAATAAVLVVCDPILLNQSTQVMTETPAAFFATAGLAAVTMLDRRRGAALFVGVILGLGALCRPSLLLWAVVAGAVWCVRACRQAGAGEILAKIRVPIAFGLGLLIVLGPWAVRNQIQFGRPIVTTTHGGYTFLLANNPEFYDWLRNGQWGGVWTADNFNADWDLRRPRDEVAANRMAWAEGWRNAAREPGTFLYGCAVRLGRFWSPLPHKISASETAGHRLSRYAVGAWYVSVFLLIIVASGKPGVRGQGSGASEKNLKSEICNLKSLAPSPSPLSPNFNPCFWLYGFLMAASLTAGQAVFWTDMRMRAPLTAVLALAAGVGVSRVAGGLRRRRNIRRKVREEAETVRLQHQAR